MCYSSCRCHFHVYGSFVVFVVRMVNVSVIVLCIVDVYIVDPMNSTFIMCLVIRWFTNIGMFVSIGVNLVRSRVVVIVMCVMFL